MKKLSIREEKTNDYADTSTVCVCVIYMITMSR